MPGFFLLIGVTFAVVAQSSIPMNRVTYAIANPAKNTSAERQFRGEFFEIYGPETTTRYSEVYWQPQSTPLPSEIVARFSGKVLGITGYEVDIVRIQTAPNGTIISEETVFPYEIYNHHFSGFMYSKGVEADMKQEFTQPHHARLQFHVDAQVDPPLGVPVIQAFSEGNGNEHRASFHGYANGFSQHIYSPHSWQNDIMIINTNKKLTNDTSPGPIGDLLPRSSLAPVNASYSGLLECPCTSRTSKILTNYKILQTNACGVSTQITTTNECTFAVQLMGFLPTTGAKSVTNKSLPFGCSVVFRWEQNEWEASFNNFSSASSSIACGSTYSSASSFSSYELAGEVFSGATSISSAQVNISLRLNASVAAFRLEGAAGAWFGVGFNATKMADLPYAIIVDGNGEITERQLGEHTAGTLLPSTIHVLSNTVKNNSRIVEFMRPSGSEFGFAVNLLPIIAAGGGAGGAVNISYHSVVKGSVQLMLTREDSVGVCICRDPSSNTGSIDGQEFNPSICAAFPTSELLSKDNAICNITRYEGGLYCCHGGTFLLDADQNVPEKMDVWRMKYRFYFEDPEVNQSKNTFRVWWSTEAYNNEYDVPKSFASCEDPHTDPEECTYTLKSVFKGVDMLGLQNGCMVPNDPNACGNITRIRENDGGLFQLVYAAGHCHAPACMSMELWDTDKQELLCVNSPIYGVGDLAGYFSGIPPCLWGSASEGLLPPPILSLDSNLTSIKRTNSTNGHWGVMGLWQMRASYLS